MRFKIHYDLGIKHLLPEWRQLFSREYLKDDIFAGISVAFIAIPLSLAIALASGVEPAVGLLTAIIASIVCAIFGGTPLAVSGPAAAMAVLIADVVYEHGFEGLLIVGLICGIMQLCSGILGVGKLIRYIPFPVVAGFSAGIGAIIFIGQAPRALGISVPDDSYVFSVIIHIWSQANNINIIALLLSLTTIGIIFILPYFFSRLPIVLVAVFIPTLFVQILQIPIETIGHIPSSLPFPKLPHLPTGDIWGLVGTAFVVFLLASVETLLSSSAVDKIIRGKPHNPDQELIGQGLGNIVTALFGGIPVTSVIARSALNVQAGAKTRRASIIHALVLLIAIYFFNTQIAEIPIPVLAGVLISVALRMLHPAEFLTLWRTEKSEALIYIGTFLSIIGFDLIYGIKVGILIAVLVACFRLSRTHAHIRRTTHIGPAVVNLEGSITFLSASQLETIRKNVLEQDLSYGLILDLGGVKMIDTSGAHQLLSYLEELIENKIKFAIKNLSPSINEILIPLDTHHILTEHLVYDDTELKHFFPDRRMYNMAKLVEGANKFRDETLPTHKNKLAKLAKAQTPHTLLIACADSRVNPHLITNADFGEIFTIRNVGNIIPMFGSNALPAEGAGIEYALGILHVENIIVCGHSSCGAITTIMQKNEPQEVTNLPSLSAWLKVASDIKHKVPPGMSIENAVKLNILLQIENIKTYPIVAEKLKANAVQIHGWYYNIETGELKEWDDQQHMFVALGTKISRELKRRIEAGLQFQGTIPDS